jgi:hypothetical protein
MLVGDMSRNKWFFFPDLNITCFTFYATYLLTYLRSPAIPNFSELQQLHVTGIKRCVNYTRMFRAGAVFLFSILENLANSTFLKTFTTPDFRNPYYVTSVPLRTQEPPTAPVSKCVPLRIPI